MKIQIRLRQALGLIVSKLKKNPGLWAAIRSKELWRIGRAAKKAYVIPPTINSLGFVFALLMRPWAPQIESIQDQTFVFSVQLLFGNRGFTIYVVPMWLKLFAGTQRNLVTLDQDLLVCVSKSIRLESIVALDREQKHPEE